MVRRPCGLCEAGVSLAGGQPNLWVLEGREPGGLLLEIDGCDEPVVVCRECLAALPAEVTARDLERRRDAHDAVD